MIKKIIFLSIPHNGLWGNGQFTEKSVITENKFIQH